ncbi:hypothetical protein L7F22_000048 [Adiantum nelumboides]|nr:hypothetical protein [Adiantum nelumboides]
MCVLLFYFKFLGPSPYHKGEVLKRDTPLPPSASSPWELALPLSFPQPRLSSAAQEASAAFSLPPLAVPCSARPPAVGKARCSSRRLRPAHVGVRWAAAAPSPLLNWKSRAPAFSEMGRRCSARQRWLFLVQRMSRRLALSPLFFSSAASAALHHPFSRSSALSAALRHHLRQGWVHARPLFARAVQARARRHSLELPLLFSLRQGWIRATVSPFSGPFLL